MKKILVAMSMALAATTANAQFDLTPNIGVGVSAGIVTGIGIDASITMTDFLGARVGYNFVPKGLLEFKKDIDITEVSGKLTSDPNYKTWLNNNSQYLLPGETDIPNHITLKSKGDLNTWHVLFDVYPLGAVNSFHVTLGAYFGSDDIFSVHNSDEGRFMIVNAFNKAVEGATPANGYVGNFNTGVDVPVAVDPSGKYHVNGIKQIGIKYGDDLLMPDAQGNASASIRVKKFRPYLGVGFGRAVPKNRVGVQFDLGCQFWGKPEVHFNGANGDEKIDGDKLKGGVGDAIDLIGGFSVCPVLKLRIVGKIF